jgi:hypothetical protein
MPRRRALLILVVAGFSLVATSPALAVDLGGGNAPTSVKHYDRKLVMISLHDANAGGVRVGVRVMARCGYGQATRRVSPAPDGSFAFATTVRGHPRDNPGVRRVARIAVSGRIAGNSASGAARVRLVFRHHGHVRSRCATKARPWQARTSASEAAAGAPRGNGAYYGLTAQDQPLVLSVDPRARRVRVAVYKYLLGCVRGPDRRLDDVTPGARIRADGTFTLTERYTYGYRNADERVRIRVVGQFTPNGVRGSLRVRTVVRALGNGRLLDRCGTGSVGFGASL